MGGALRSLRTMVKAKQLGLTLPRTHYLWSVDLAYHVVRANWEEVNLLLDAFPSWHCKFMLQKLAEYPLWGPLYNSGALRAFRILLHRCVSDHGSGRRFDLMPLAETMIFLGCLEQLRVLLTANNPEVRRQLWGDARNLRTLRYLLVVLACGGRDEKYLWVKNHDHHAACLRMACQLGMFAVHTRPASPPSSPSSSDDSSTNDTGSSFTRNSSTALYKAVFYNRPHLVRLLYDAGAVSHVEMLDLVPLAESNATEDKRDTRSIADRIDALGSEFGLSDQGAQLACLLLHMAVRHACSRNKCALPRSEDYKAHARDIAHFLKTQASRPRSLQSTCLLTVSSAVGVGRDRKGRDRMARIQKLRLPAPLERALSLEDHFQERVES